MQFSLDPNCCSVNRRPAAPPLSLDVPIVPLGKFFKHSIVPLIRKQSVNARSLVCIILLHRNDANLVIAWEKAVEDCKFRALGINRKVIDTPWSVMCAE